MSIKKQLSPKEATSYKKIESLKLNNISTGDYWAVIKSDTITIVQDNGGFDTHEIVIPRKDFNKLIKWYTTKQNIK